MARKVRTKQEKKKRRVKVLIIILEQVDMVVIDGIKRLILDKL